MRRWAVAPVAWVRDEDDVLVLSTAAPLRAPLRLSGSAAGCWRALTSADSAVSAEWVAEHVLGSDPSQSDVTVRDIVADIDSFLESLADEGLLSAVPPE